MKRILAKGIAILVPILLAFGLLAPQMPATAEILSQSSVISEDEHTTIKETPEFYIGKQFASGKTEESHFVGDIISWKITTFIPVSLSEGAEFDVFYIEDVLDPVFDFISATVKILNYDGNGNDLALIANPDNRWNYELTSIGQTVKINFGEQINDLAAYSGKTIEILLKAMLNDKAAEDAEGSANNTAQLYFATGGYNKTSLATTVYFGSVTIEKVEKGNKFLKLKGAKFGIATSKDKAEKNEFLQQIKKNGMVVAIVEPGVTLKDFEATYYPLYNLNDGSNWTIEDWILTTGADGLATFSGLRYDLTSTGTSYWFKEVAAPFIDQINFTGETYHILKAPVTPHAPLNAEAGVHNNEIKFLVENGKGVVFPLTGNGGLIMSTVFGAVLMCCSVILLFVFRKRKKPVKQKNLRVAI